MKTTRKLLVMVMALILALGMCSQAFAADDATYKITINDPAEGHTYTAYQIFSGDLEETEVTEGEDDDAVTTTVKILSNIQWGEDVNVPTAEEDVAAFIAAINAALELTGEDALAATATAADVAEKLVTASVDQLKAFMKVLEGDDTTTYLKESTKNDVDGVISGLKAGYYLVIDTTDPDDLPTGDTYSDFIIQVVSNVEINHKGGSVTVDKTVGDINDSGVVEPEEAPAVKAVEDTVEEGETADWDIGDDVPYTIVTNLPDNYSAFTTFLFRVNDTLSKGLTYNEDTVVVKVLVPNVDAETGEIIPDSFKEVDITEYFTVSCTAVVDDEGTETGKNLLKIECADLVAADTDEETGKNCLYDGARIIITYTAQLNEDAVTTEEGNPNTVYVEFSNDPNHEGIGETIEDTVTVFTYELNVYKVDDKEAPLAGAGFTLYKLVEKTEGEGDDAEIVYDWEIVGSEVMVAADDEGNYVANWKGLDDGIYKVVETTTPGGYNTAADVYFEIVAEHDEPAEGTVEVSLTIYDGEFDEDEMTWTRGDEHETVTATSTVLSTTIINNPGTILPSTGGVGTTLFYIIGAILVIGAGVLLIARKRVND